MRLLVLATVLFTQGTVPDDWQAVRSALFSALDNFFNHTALPETLTVQNLNPESRWGWVFEPLLEEYVTERGAVVLPQSRVALRFTPLQLRIEKRASGLWGRTVRRQVTLKCWVSIQTRSGTVHWIARGGYRDQYPVNANPLTEIEGLSPNIRRSIPWPQQVLVTLMVGGVLYMLYSGGR